MFFLLLKTQNYASCDCWYMAWSLVHAGLTLVFACWVCLSNVKPAQPSLNQNKTSESQCRPAFHHRDPRHLLAFAPVGGHHPLLRGDYFCWVPKTKGNGDLVAVAFYMFLKFWFWPHQFSIAVQFQRARGCTGKTSKGDRKRLNLTLSMTPWNHLHDNFLKEDRKK